MCDSCKCGCKPGKPEKGCQCSCKECRAARQSVSKGFLVSKRDYQDFTQGAAIAGGSMAGMAGYGKLRRMKGVNGAMPFKGGLAASAVGGLGAYLATDAAFKRRKKNARDLAQYRAMVGKSLFELSGMAKENAMNEKYLVSKAFRDLDEVEKSYNYSTPVRNGRRGDAALSLGSAAILGGVGTAGMIHSPRLFKLGRGKGAAVNLLGGAALTGAGALTAGQGFRQAKEARQRKQKIKAKSYQRASMDEVEKGFLTPVKGIRGGFMTRRFPEMTSSGKRQIARNKAAKLEERGMESASRLRSRQESYRSNVADNADRRANAQMLADSRKRAALKANKRERLPADMIGAANRTYI